MKRPFYSVILMGAVAAALALVLDGCKKEAAEGPDLGLNKESIDLKIGETFNLKVTNLPEGASGVNIRWASDDDKVATVDQNGLVTATGTGRAIIAAWTNNASHVAKCKVCVPRKINSYTIPDDFFPIWRDAENPIELPFTCDPPSAKADDFIWEFLPNQTLYPDGEFELSVNDRAYIKALKAGSGVFQITPKDGNMELVKRYRIYAYEHRFNIYPSYTGYSYLGPGLEDGEEIDVSKLNKDDRYGKPYVLLKSCQFEWDKNDDRRFNLDDPSIVDIGGYISPIELTLTVVPKKSGKTTLTITNKQLDIRGAVENVFVRKVVLRVP